MRDAAPVTAAGPPVAGSPPAGLRRALPALLLVYLVFGSAVVAVKFAVASVPPLVIGARFAPAGLIILAVLALRGVIAREPPGWAGWGAALLVGAGLLLGGQGGSAIALQTLPAGLVALLFASVPLWAAALGWTLLGRRLGGREALGLLAGLAGMALLVGPEAASGSIDGGSLLLCLGAALSWAAASVYAPRSALPHDAMLATALQITCGGTLLLLASLADGELARFDPTAVTASSLLAMTYLFVVVSLIGFPAYTWLLQNTSPVLAGSVTYVAPLVATLLSWALLGEPIGGRTLAAAVLVIGSVALMVTAEAPAHRRPAPGAPCCHRAPRADGKAAPAEDRTAPG